MGNMELWGRIAEADIIIELEFPEVTEKYKMTVLEKWNWGTGLYYFLSLGIGDAIPRLPCPH